MECAHSGEGVKLPLLHELSLLYFLFFWIGVLHVAQAGLELAVYLRLIQNTYYPAPVS